MTAGAPRPAAPGGSAAARCRAALRHLVARAATSGARRLLRLARWAAAPTARDRAKAAHPSARPLYADGGIVLNLFPRKD